MYADFDENLKPVSKGSSTTVPGDSIGVTLLSLNLHHCLGDPFSAGADWCFPGSSNEAV
jgi:hypothetical protein